MSDARKKTSVLGRMRKTSERAEEGHGADTAANLDDEMEKVFAMAEDDRFDVAKFAASPSDSNASKKSFGEEDYSLHRKKSYPHIHMPLKSLHSRSMRKRGTQRESDSENTDGTSVETASRKPSRAETDSEAGPSPMHSTATSEEPTASAEPRSQSPEDEQEELVQSLDSQEAQISERAASFDSNMYASPLSVEALRRVQFQIGDISEVPMEETSPEGDASADPAKDGGDGGRAKRKSSRHHHHHHKSRKYSLQEDPQWRVRAGSEFADDAGHGRRVSIQPEEVSQLHEYDIDDLNSHRSDDTKGSRRYKGQLKNVPASLIHIGRKDGFEGLQHLKKMFDHTPHEVFVQLDELSGDGEDREWKETARWIKYEEDVEEGADRWGRPHVASLSFHSLLNLRRCLETGVVLLDLEEKDLPGVAYRVVEQMVVDELILPDDKAVVMRALLLRHRHVNEHERFRFGTKKSFSSYTSLQSLSELDEDSRSLDSSCTETEIREDNLPIVFAHNLSDEKGRPKIVPSVTSMDGSPTKGSTNLSTQVEGENHTIDMKEEMTYTSSSDDLKRAQKESILKRIPFGAEATTVLVGAVDFLDQPTIAFIRLAEGILMPSITEVTMPVRFMFILLGPKITDLDYHEIGRSISTLMSNIQFHKIAYKAEERKDLLSAINEFLDDSIVLPPGDWEKKALLPFEELKAKSEMIKRRKDKRVKAHDAAQRALMPDDGEGKPPFDDPLARTRRPFGGLIKDIKRRLPHYVSDFVDGFNFQCLAAAIFMYFAALSGAITFGGLMGDKTDNMIGISETLISTSIAGILFALFSGQPLIIVGATGPLLLFDESLYSFCDTNKIHFLTIRVYIGMWLGIIALVVVCFEGSVLVKLFTRFTEEIFAALISLLYIIESFMKLVMVFGRHPLLKLEDYCDEYIDSYNNTGNGTFIGTILPSGRKENSTEIGFSSENISTTMASMTKPPGPPVDQPNTALFCTILALGTFFIAYYLRQFRNSKFLGRNVRRALGDFGVPIAIVSMVLLDYLNPNTYTEKLKVPEGLSPSNEAVRGWIISPANLDEVWMAFAALAPALLVYILLFMETHICELIIDKKDRKLKKGSGFHLDIVVVCLLNVGCGFMGAPWVCAATVRSIAHVSAVTVMSRTHAPGDKPHIIEVKEQRMSALVVSVLVGLSVLMAPLLRLVPIAVLFGVFLYMGVSSTNGIQFFERMQLFFMPVKHHPQVPYVRRVHSMKMHLFTFIQLMCLAVLWVVKSTQASLAFPFFLILMVPLRAQLRFIFTAAELRALDSNEPDEDKEDDEPDFYTEAPLPG